MPNRDLNIIASHSVDLSVSPQKHTVLALALH